MIDFFVAVAAIWVLVARNGGLAAGAIAICGVGTKIAWLVTLRWDDGWEQWISARMKAGFLLGLPSSVAALMLVAALLEIVDRIVGPGARLRLMLEAGTVASGVFVPLWVFVLRPGNHLITSGSCMPVIMAIALASVVIGLSLVLAVRRRVGRWRLAVRCLGASVAASASAAIAIGACYGDGLVMVIGALALPVGAGLWLFGPSITGLAAVDQSPQSPERISPNSGLATGLVPVIAVSAVAALGFVKGGGVDVVTTLVGIANGVFLVARQYLAYLDARRAYDRLAESESHFRELAHTDPLTGLANRRGLLRTLYLEITKDSGSCVLLTMDLDGFKNVNDMRGHDVGDTVLIEVGQRLRLNLRPGDLAARLGGDEFAVLMWTTPTDAMKVAKRLLTVLERPYHVAGGAIFLSASVGLAGCATADSIHSLLRNADLAQRAAKQRGKNRLELYDEVYDKETRRRSQIEHEMRGAIERDELVLAYQPVVSLPSVRPVGAEALLRWNHPDLGMVPPGEFIPIAEESGQIEALGTWVLHQACRQLSRWVAEGHDVWVSVNVSPRELHSAQYVTLVKEVLRAHRVAPSRLVLEVTETAMASDVDEFRRIVQQLRGLGVRIALDDFGAGYSSLGQLRTLPVDILKIDHALVATDEDDAPLVDVVVRLGERLGLKVIAEGVSEPHHRRAVEKALCPLGQGMLFGRPVPAEHLEAMLVSMPPLPRPAPPGTERKVDTIIPISGSS